MTGNNCLHCLSHLYPVQRSLSEGDVSFFLFFSLSQQNLSLHMLYSVYAPNVFYWADIFPSKDAVRQLVLLSCIQGTKCFKFFISPMCISIFACNLLSRFFECFCAFHWLSFSLTLRHAFHFHYNGVLT